MVDGFGHPPVPARMVHLVAILPQRLNARQLLEVQASAVLERSVPRTRLAIIAIIIQSLFARIIDSTIIIMSFRQHVDTSIQGLLSLFSLFAVDAIIVFSESCVLKQLNV